MKKLITILSLTALIIFAVLKTADFNPYSGSYQLRSNANLTLKINKDNSFIIYNTIGKNSENITGSYKINDNSIILTPDKDSMDKFLTSSMHGKVEGSQITISELNDIFIKIK